MKKASLFITFEGGEGAGKTSLIRHIASFLDQKSLSYISTREPGGTVLGEGVRKLLLDHYDYPMREEAELSLFLASRAQHVEEVIKPNLEKGKVVLCDRFNDSSVAYQGHARDLGMEKVRSFCDFVSQGIDPDLTFYLDIAPQTGLQRACKKWNDGHDRIEVETLSFHEKVRQGFLLIAKNEPDRVKILNAEKPLEKVFEDAEKLLNDLIKMKGL